MHLVAGSLKRVGYETLRMGNWSRDRRTPQPRQENRSRCSTRSSTCLYSNWKWGLPCFLLTKVRLATTLSTGSLTFGRDPDVRFHRKKEVFSWSKKVRYWYFSLKVVEKWCLLASALHRQAVEGWLVTSLELGQNSLKLESVCQEIVLSLWFECSKNPEIRKQKEPMASLK